MIKIVRTKPSEMKEKRVERKKKIILETLDWLGHKHLKTQMLNQKTPNGDVFIVVSVFSSAEVITENCSGVLTLNATGTNLDGQDLVDWVKEKAGQW